MTSPIYVAVKIADEAYLLSQSTKYTLPLDEWKESHLWYPKKNLIVLGWDGCGIFRCRYDETKCKWYDEEGQSAHVFMWRRK